MNWFFGIDETTGRLVADFEDTGSDGRANHPVTGMTAFRATTWHHAAVTYDGDRHLAPVPRRQPRADAASWQLAAASRSHPHAALGTAHRRAPASPPGFFDGALDEVRVWNVARSQAQIQAAEDVELTRGHRAVGPLRPQRGQRHRRRQLDAARLTGTLVGGPVWVAGAPLGPATRAPASGPASRTATGEGASSASTGRERGRRPRGLQRLPRHVTPVPTTGTPLNGATPLAAPLHGHDRGRARPTSTSSPRSMPPTTSRPCAWTRPRRRSRPRSNGARLRRHRRPRHVRRGAAARRRRRSRSRPGSGATAPAWRADTGTGGIDERHAARHQGPGGDGRHERRHELLPRHHRGDRNGWSPTSRSAAHRAGLNHP